MQNPTFIKQQTGRIDQLKESLIARRRIHFVGFYGHGSNNSIPKKSEIIKKAMALN